MIIIQISTLTVVFGFCIVISWALTGTVKTKSSIIALCSLILFGVCIHFMLPEHMSRDIVSFSSTIIAIILCTFITHGLPKIQILYIVLLLFGVATTASTLVQWLGYITSNELDNYKAYDFVAKSVLLIICIIAAKKGSLIGILLCIVQLQKFARILILLSVWISALLASLFTYLFNAYSNLPGFAVIGILSATLILLMGIMCPLLIIKILSGLRFESQSALMEEQLELQLTHYEAIAKMYEDIKRFKHDYDNLSIALTETLKRNDVRGAMMLLNSEEMTLSGVAYPFKTGCVILDALLHEKQVSASEINISLTFEGVVPGNLLSPVDICIIFGNALDNAIEACAKLEYEKEKAIAVHSVHRDGFLFIRIENPTAADVHIIDNNIMTTKSNANFSGIGLRSIKIVAEKYFGKVILSYSGGIFCLEIELDFNMQADL